MPQFILRRIKNNGVSFQVDEMVKVWWKIMYTSLGESIYGN